MTRKVVTYQSPAQLLRSDSIFQKEYQGCLHIVATNSLKSGLGESIRDHRWIHAPILTFSELFKELAGNEWSSPKAQLGQFLYLSDVMSRLWEQDTGSSRLKVQALERNQMQVLKTMRVLTELGAVPSDILAHQGKASSSEKLFAKIWGEMGELLASGSEKLEKFLTGKMPVKRGVEEALLNWQKSFNSKTGALATVERTKSNLPAENKWEYIISSLKANKIVLHGFYFITPIQQRVFKQLEEEYELIFLNAYDERFPNTFETVKVFLDIGVNETFRSVEDFVPVHPLSAKMLETFEGGSKIKTDYEVDAYVDLPHFIEAETKRLYQQNEVKDRCETEDIIENEPYHLLTPRAKEVEEQLVANGFVPAFKQKLTDYPVGQFLYRIHQMRSRHTDLQTGSITFNEAVTSEIILDCFSSGCLIVDKEDMREYVRPLEKILPYCGEISKFQDWYDRIENLAFEKKLWENLALEGNPYALSSRIHKFHSLPMRQLSYFSVDHDEIEKVIKGIKALEQIHNTLFTNWESKKVSMGTHLKTVERLVLKSVEEYFESTEKEIVKKLIDEIAGLKDDELEFSLKDITKGLLFYLDGSLGSLEEQENGAERVYSFDSSDAAPFRTNRQFHLAFADQKALPISQGFDMWPVSRELMAQLEQNFPELGLLEKRKNLSNSITRYLLYVLFSSADNIRFSYVEHLGKESRLDLALYLKLLGFKPKPAERDFSETSLKETKEPAYTGLENTDWTSSMVREARVCPKRASFSFILNEHTTFRSDFHHGFLYGNYISVLNETVGNKFDQDMIRSVVDPWFPQWNNMKRDFLYEDITARFKRRGISENKVKVDGVEYSQGISYFNLLPTSYAGNKNNLIPYEEVTLHEASPGKHCRYCPYLSSCSDGIYQIDYEEDEQ